MRIRRLSIKAWRHFRDISIVVDPETALVCIVGANGTGKSHLLEFIAVCAHRLGMSPGVDIPRGDPFNDPHDFGLEFFLAPDASEKVDALAASAGLGGWDRTLRIESRRGTSVDGTWIFAGGIADAAQSQTVAGQVVDALRQSKNVHFLSLDADRAYPKKSYNANEVAQAYETDWGNEEYTRGRSFRSTTTLYDEWMKYFLAQENQSGTRLIQGIRRANKDGTPPPTFSDHFANYSEALQRVLPHVVFTGVDSRTRALLFDTTGLELTFSQLSGGEREIAFLVGQIDRFGLRQGLLLLDEPELHLNADLIRSWVTYLTGTVVTGQVWLATHSLEAVEAAGQRATFVLERDAGTKLVANIARLDSRPVLSVLSRAVGTPAFSISQLVFVFIEGEESIGERERFKSLTVAAAHYRFMECGSCNEVVRRVMSIRALASEGEAPIRIGGAVDRDFRTVDDVTGLEQSTGVHVLRVHEVENFFLHPPTIGALLEQNGDVNTDPQSVVVEAANRRAGAWILQYAVANWPDAPALIGTVRDDANRVPWSRFTADSALAIASISAGSGLPEGTRQALEARLEIGRRAYERRLTDGSIWKVCEGKQALPYAAAAVGFGSTESLVRAVLSIWDRRADLIPQELQALRQYVDNL